MGLGLLPLEKIPLFVWGTILSLIGGFLVSHEDPFSWPQGRAVLLFVIGAAAIVYDLRKRFSTHVRIETE